jgi:predicted molibdopterin-dependent oxidoreductase YjgC
VADAWAACCDDEGEAVSSIGLLVVSGDEAAADENVRALAEQAEATIVVSMYGGLSAGWADLILPGTSYLERDGTFVNLEGRLQRLRRTVEPPCPDELDWISQLAARFDVDVAPYAAAVFAEVSERVYGGLAFGEVGERAPLRGYPEAQEHVGRESLPEPQQKTRRGEIRLVPYKPLFSGAAVERVAELQFQRPQPELEISAGDARRRKVATGDFVTVGSNGSAITLPVRVNRHLRDGIARVALEHANGLQGIVEVAKAEEARV